MERAQLGHNNAMHENVAQSNIFQLSASNLKAMNSANGQGLAGTRPEKHLRPGQQRKVVVGLQAQVEARAGGSKDSSSVGLGSASNTFTGSKTSMGRYGGKGAVGRSAKSRNLLQQQAGMAEQLVSERSKQIKVALPHTYMNPAQKPVDSFGGNCKITDPVNFMLYGGQMKDEVPVRAVEGAGRAKSPSKMSRSERLGLDKRISPEDMENPAGGKATIGGEIWKSFEGSTSEAAGARKDAKANGAAIDRNNRYRAETEYAARQRMQHIQNASKADGVAQALRGGGGDLGGDL